MDKPKGIPRSFWSMYGSQITALFIVLVVVVCVSLFGVWLHGEMGRMRAEETMQRQRETTQAMAYCLDRHTDERDLLVCMERVGFTVLWDMDRNGYSGAVRVDEYWPESEES